jgi:hypothetical protein
MSDGFAGIASTLLWVVIIVIIIIVIFLLIDRFVLLELPLLTNIHMSDYGTFSIDSGI